MLYFAVYVFTKKYFDPCVYRCLKFLGSRHPTLVLPLVPELLSTHPFFDTPEPDMDDPACILVTKPADLFHSQTFSGVFPLLEFVKLFQTSRWSCSYPFATSFYYSASNEITVIL